MKRKLFVIPALALILASCASEEPAGNNNQNPEYAAATSYLNINLLPSSGMGQMGVKAAGTRYTEGDGTYEDGSATENNVTRVRFYFFGEGGAPFAVRQNLATGEYDNFVDWYPNATEVGEGNHDETVEKTLNATLGLTFTDNEERPGQVLAVANPTDEILYFNNTAPGENMSSNCMSLAQLQEVVSNYRPYDSNNFVMSNSVYLDTNKQPVYTTALNEDNFQTTPVLAALPENVVNIYIERVLARVDFGVTLENETLEGMEGTFYKVGVYTLNDESEDGETQENEPIYVNLLGWNVTSTTGTSRLIKEINPGWTNTQILGSDVTPWSTSDYHRSFWALNPEGVEIQYGNFGNVTSLPTITPSGQFATSLEIPTGTGFSTTYLQENANPFENDNDAAAPTYPSKVIIAAQLVDKTGQPITICEWGYNKYTLAGLKNQIAKSLPNLYYKIEEPGATGYAQIDANMITFTTNDPLVAEDSDEKSKDKEYYVYAVLTGEAENLTWALKSGNTYVDFNTDGNAVSIPVQVNQYIRGIVNHAMIWNSGLTYYFFDIRHLGAKPTDAGYLGIVRNHLYRTTVTKLAGLGTPVYDPSKEIHPEVTNPEETVIAAKINILSWRLVTSSYELNWD